VDKREVTFEIHMRGSNGGNHRRRYHEFEAL
jgi:hypothetical protein